jgi:hypothetical protein
MRLAVEQLLHGAAVGDRPAHQPLAAAITNAAWKGTTAVRQQIVYQGEVISGHPVRVHIDLHGFCGLCEEKRP